MEKQLYLKRIHPQPMDYRKYIEINANNRYEKPIIKGTGLSVNDVLSWLSLQMSSAKIVEAYPNLTIGSIKACLAYAAERGDRQKQIV